MEDWEKMKIDNRKIWLKGSIVDLKDANINILAPTSQFGANVFEGIRCYYNEEKQQLFAFRLEDHYKRLLDSIKLFQMECDYNIDFLKKALVDVVKANKYMEDIAVRQTVFIDGFGTWSSKGPVNMFVSPIPKHRNKTESLPKQTCKISSWTRISDSNMSPRAKVGANYINSRLGQLEAIEAGYDTCIFMNDAGKISEGPGSCFFMIKNKKLITPPLTASVLESITRNTIITIAKEKLNIEVIERNIDRTELYLCDEAFLCGSAMEIGPINKIDGYIIGKGTVGTITKELHKNYIEILEGESSCYSGWLTAIY